MELIIDNQPCDLPCNHLTLPGFDFSQTGDLNALREGRTLRITLPRTATNDRLIGRPCDPQTAIRFNATDHRARIEVEGTPLLQGSIHLLTASDEGYTLELHEPGSGWASQAALQQLHELHFDYKKQLTPQTICESWRDDSPVRFFPIHRDDYGPSYNSLDLLPSERILSVDDYHPFLHLASLLEQLFRESGYTLKSQFLQSALFRSLYISGAYSTRDTAAAASHMGFLAKRLGSVTAVANAHGRVVADPFVQADYSVGNLVESATPQSVDAEGKVVTGLYNHGNCFSLTEDGAICYTPLTTASVAFAYYLKYTTSHRILTRHRLAGFDSLYLGPGNELHFTLTNRYEDRREALNAEQRYRVLVFDHTAGASYRLSVSLDGVSDQWSTTFAERSASVILPASGSPSNPQLEILHGTTWEPYTGDWAMYDGHIEEYGQTIVELRIRTASELLTPSTPKSFDTIYFFGADEGMTLTLHPECSIEAHFLSTPGFGSSITFQDVAQLQIRQIELLEAVAHLFNLRFATDEAIKTVYIEPYDDFYGSHEVDWRDKVDWEEPICFTDLTPQLHASRTWCYEAGDGAVKRFEAQEGTSLGSWTYTTNSYATLRGKQVLRNPLFRASVSSVGHYTNAPSARLLQVGNRDNPTEDATNFSPRIVSYLGMHQLAAGEWWGHPANEGAYPLVAFHFAGDETTEGLNLGFEDREEVTGLHRYYDRALHDQVYGGRISLSLHLPPHRLASLLRINDVGGDRRAIFRLSTPEGDLSAILEQIEAFDPATGIIRCHFIRVDR